MENQLPGKTYIFAVEAFNDEVAEELESSLSNYSSLELLPPGVPTGISLSQPDDTDIIEITWTEPEYLGLFPNEISYEIRMSMGEGSLSYELLHLTEFGVTSYTVFDVKAETVYNVKVRAVNIFGTSLDSLADSITT